VASATPPANSTTHTLFTIGYEGRSLEALIAELRELGVDVLVDVRELPLSRKRGFSKNRLSQGLAAAGIDYVHLRPLGSPRAARHRLYEDGNYEAFFEAYADHLESQQAAMGQLAALVESAYACLMCYEAEAARCHRSLLASRLEAACEPTLEVIHQ
jgi:uncharacterized protein (DUF488 family)